MEYKIGVGSGDILEQSISEQQQAIAAALQKRLGREVKLVTKINPDLMGGAVIRAGDLVSTVRSKAGCKM